MCPRCEAGFIEEVTEDSRYNPNSALVLESMVLSMITRMQETFYSQKMNDLLVISVLLIGMKSNLYLIFQFLVGHISVE